MALKIINNYIYFYQYGKYCIIPTYLDTVTDVMSTKFASENALSRTAPVFSYVQSGPRTMSVSIALHRDMLCDSEELKSIRSVFNMNRLAQYPNEEIDFESDAALNKYDFVDTLIRYLQASSLPRFSTKNHAITPPEIALRLSDELFIRGVITSDVSVTYNKPILANGKYAKVTVAFSVSEVVPYDGDNALTYGSFRTVAAGAADPKKIFTTASSGPKTSPSATTGTASGSGWKSIGSNNTGLTSSANSNSNTNLESSNGRSIKTKATLINKSYKTYDYVSRYMYDAYYYNSRTGKYMGGLASHISTDTDHIVHNVGINDTFDSLAYHYYGRPDLYWVIADFNRINDSYAKLFGKYKTIKVPSITGIKVK